nr:DUF1508 domain-containing protein [uncultured Pseudomonas sp.]
MSAHFQIKKAKDAQYHVQLLAGNGEIILASELFKSKETALNTIEAIKNSSKKEDSFTLRELSNGKYLFLLRASSGQIIGSSQVYATLSGAKLGINSVIANAPHASIQDLTTPHSGSKHSSRQTEYIGSIRTFLTEISNIPPDRESIRFYRGHGNYKYDLIPSIYRNKGWIKNESTMLHELMLRCPNDFDISGSTFSNLVKMQHYSLPTRLLDLTANPLIALYFACEDEKPHDAEVVAFRVPKKEIRYYDSDTVSVISNISRMPPTFSAKKNPNIEVFNQSPEIVRLVREIQREKPYFEGRIESTHLKSVVCVKPVLDNPRIIKQDGAFFLFGMGLSKLDPAEIPEQYLASSNELRMIIRGADKRKILQQLELLGITKQSIYPEIEHVAGYIKSAYMEY